MDAALTILSFALAVVSVVIGVAAIWLSLVLYRFSDGALKQIQAVSNRVDRSVGILEHRVDGLHQDTFSLIRETVADMRGALWKGGDSADGTRMEHALEQELKAIKTDLLEKLNSLDVSQPADQRQLESEVDALLRRSADAGRDARRAVIGRYVEEILRERPQGTSAADLMSTLAQEFPFSTVMDCLRELIAKGVIEAEPPGLRPKTRLSLRRPVARRA